MTETTKTDRISLPDAFAFACEAYDKGSTMLEIAISLNDAKATEDTITRVSWELRATRDFGITMAQRRYGVPCVRAQRLDPEACPFGTDAEACPDCGSRGLHADDCGDPKPAPTAYGIPNCFVCGALASSEALAVGINLCGACLSKARHGCQTDDGGRRVQRAERRDAEMESADGRRRLGLFAFGDLVHIQTGTDLRAARVVSVTPSGSTVTVQPLIPKPGTFRRTDEGRAFPGLGAGQIEWIADPARAPQPRFTRRPARERDGVAVFYQTGGCSSRLRPGACEFIDRSF